MMGSRPPCSSIPLLLVVPLQNELAKKAVKDLAAVFGTKYTYGSIANTICECPSLIPHPKPLGNVFPSGLLSLQTWQEAPPWTGPTTTG